ncbi:addiction module antidote protein [Acinetobacter pittii]|uniref:addiction module antidote protein n=1 Tax=Acinetobacter pittii TaxID=48296 RepID=UPI003A4DFFE9
MPDRSPSILLLQLCSPSSSQISALGVIAKARGMTQIAKEAGIGREALYKALRHDSAPRFDTINRVVNALGLKLTVQHT